MNTIVMDDVARGVTDVAPPALSIRNLDFWYGTNHALKGISLDFPER